MSFICGKHGWRHSQSPCETCRKAEVSDANNSALAHRHGFKRPFDETDLDAAFLAGAAWQREQDAKICDELGRSHDDVYTRTTERIADAIREQGNQVPQAVEPKCCCWDWDHPPCSMHPRPGEPTHQENPDG